MKIIIRLTHKYLSVLIAIQLLLWTISGIYFAFNNIADVRGEQYRLVQNSIFDLTDFNLEVEASNSIKIMKRLGAKIAIVTNENGKEYFDQNGDNLGQLTSQQAQDIVRQKTNLQPLESVYLDTAATGSEYRGRTLPLFKVSTLNADGDAVAAYVDVTSGEVVAIRSNQWRVWDFMWGLHIMDWQARDNIGNLFMKVFSILSLISSLTGLFLFFFLNGRKTK